MIAGGALCLGGATLLWWTFNPFPHAQIGDGREVRVVHVSFGTVHVFPPETIWNTSIRQLPRQWQQYLGVATPERLTTVYDSLVVWTTEQDRARQPVSRSGLDEAFAIMPDGRLIAGTKSNRKGGAKVSFSSYARGHPEVPFRLRYGTNIVELKVKNPQRAKPEQWVAWPLPQTNQVKATQLVLERFNRSHSGASYDVRLRAKGDGARAGWLMWRTAAFDSWGNWVGHSAMSTVPTIPPGLSTDEPVWKIRAQGVEYVSAGFIEVPQPGEARVIPVPERGKRLGVKFLLWAGPGTYRIDPKLNVVCTTSNAVRTALLVPNGSVWQLECSQANVFGMSDGGEVQVRVRERVGERGRVFVNARRTGAQRTLDNPTLSAEVFSPQLPAATTNLEMEIVANLPPAEFFVAPHLLDTDGLPAR